MASDHDARGVRPVRDAFSLYESGTAVPVWLDGCGMSKRNAQLYELSQHQLAHFAVFQHRSQRDGGVPECADALSAAGRRAAPAPAAHREKRRPRAPRVIAFRHRGDADFCRLSDK
ncbi:hypothetical protein D3C78_1118280 [compost metagenome]